MRTNFRKPIALMLSITLILSSFSALSAFTASAEELPESLITYDLELYEQYKDAVEAVAEGAKENQDSISIKNYNLPRSSVSKFMETVLYMHPELFNMDSRFRYSYSGDYITSINPNYNYTKSEYAVMLKKFDEKADWYLSKVNDNMSDFEKALTLHDELILNNEYSVYITDENGTTRQTDVYDLMVTGIGKCYGYSEAYSYLLSKLGIYTEQVTSDSMNHQWTKVYLDGSWYHVDVTWDDPTADKVGQACHTYFLLSDTAFPEDTDNNQEYDHYDYTSSFNSTDTKYDSYSYHNSIAKICKAGNELYMIENMTYENSKLTYGNLVKYDYETDTQSTVKQLKYYWKVAGTSSVYIGTYSSLEAYNGYIYYNSSDAVYAYNPESGETVDFYTSTSESDLYGFRVIDGKLYGAYADSANSTRTLEYCADCLEHPHVYGGPEWSWSGDLTSATATFTCTSGDDKQIIEADIADENGVLTASVKFCGETYTDTIESTYKTSDGSYINLDASIQRDEEDTVLTGIGSEFKNLEILGVQVKKASLSVENDTHSVRFISVVNNDILADADDYGFIATGGNTIEEARENIDSKTVENSKLFSCKGSNNNVSGDYGKYSTDKKYKYITFAINDIKDYAASVKFYIKKGDTVIYAGYTNSADITYNNCAVNWAALS